MARDYYEVLGVARDADEGAVKKAFRQKALKLHPDQNPDNPNAEEAFKELNEAYAVLSDQSARAKYDRFGHADFHQHVNMDDVFRGADFSSVFSGLGIDPSMFSSIFGGGRGGGSPFPGGGSRHQGGFRQAPRKGQDVLLEVEVSFHEAALGGERHVNFQRQDGPRELTVRVPPGIKNGSKVRVRGEGMPSPSGGPPGDLLLKLKVAPHPRLTRDGADIRTTVEVPFSTLVLGGTAVVPTLDGDKKIRVAAGTKPGAQQRLRGLGAGKEGARGALFVTLQPRVPETLEDEQREAVEAIRELGL